MGLIAVISFFTKTIFSSGAFANAVVMLVLLNVSCKLSAFAKSSSSGSLKDRVKLFILDTAIYGQMLFCCLSVISAIVFFILCLEAIENVCLFDDSLIEQKLPGVFAISIVCLSVVFNFICALFLVPWYISYRKKRRTS